MGEQLSEKGHWYTRDGQSCYSIIGKNKKERNTTLKDARKLDLVPSVTTIIALAAKPMLERWKQDQTILACLTLPRNENESEQEYIARLKKDAGEQARKAAAKGETIHAYVQNGFEGKQIPEEGLKFYNAAKIAIEKECGKQEWICEKSFASPLGYGGKIDISNDKYVLDFKTTEKDLETIQTWDDHDMQLGAYDEQKGRKCGIVYINVNTAEAKLLWIDSSKIERGFNCFMALLVFWQAKNNFGMFS